MIDLKRLLLIFSTFLGFEVPEKMEKLVNLLAELIKLFVSIVFGLLKLILSVVFGKLI